MNELMGPPFFFFFGSSCLIEWYLRRDPILLNSRTPMGVCYCQFVYTSSERHVVTEWC